MVGGRCELVLCCRAERVIHAGRNNNALAHAISESSGRRYLLGDNGLYEELGTLYGIAPS